MATIKWREVQRIWNKTPKNADKNDKWVKSFNKNTYSVLRVPVFRLWPCCSTILRRNIEHRSCCLYTLYFLWDIFRRTAIWQGCEHANIGCQIMGWRQIQTHTHYFVTSGLYLCISSVLLRNNFYVFLIIIKSNRFFSLQYNVYEETHTTWGGVTELNWILYANVTQFIHPERTKSIVDLGGIWIRVVMTGAITIRISPGVHAVSWD